MPGHLTEDTLRRFVAGTLDEQEAEAAALHVDDCQLCANRTLVADPLCAFFASVDDPHVHPVVRSRVLAKVQERGADLDPLRPWLGLTLLLVAATLFFAAGEPWELARRLLTLVIALGVGAGAVLRSFTGSAWLLSALALCTLAISLSAVRLLGLSRNAA